MKYLSHLFTLLLSSASLFVVNTYALASNNSTMSPYFSANAGYGYVAYKQAATPASASFKTKNFIWGGNLGVLFNRHIGLDLGYLKFSNVDQKDNTGSRNILKNNYLLTAAIKGVLYGDECMGLYLKAGAAQVNTYQSSTNVAVRKYVPYAALGVIRNFSENFSLGLVGTAVMPSGGFGTAIGPNRTPGFYSAALELTYTV